MSDQDDSGNRWEPGEEQAAAPENSAAPEPGAAATDAPAPGGVTERRDLLRVSRTQAGLAGAGALLLLGGGLGGFFIGHATGGDGHDGRHFPGMGRDDFGLRGQADGNGHRGQIPPGAPGQNGTGQTTPGQSGTDQG